MPAVKLLGWLTLIGLAVLVGMMALLKRHTAVESTSRSADRQYTVQPGDALSGIADRDGTTVVALARANGLADADRIEVGQRLRLTGGAVQPKPQPARPPPSTEEPPAGPDGAQPEIRRSMKERCRYYFVSLSELDEARLGVLTRQRCPTLGDYYERVEINCQDAAFRYIGGADEVAGIVARPSDWIDLVAGSAKDDTAKFVCARAGRPLGDRPPEQVLPEVPTDAELHILFMDCSALASSLMSAVVQKRCFDIGSYLHGRYIHEERFGTATQISDRMKALGWWGWVSPKYRPVR